MAGQTISQGLTAKLGLDMSPYSRGLRRAVSQAKGAGKRIGRGIAAAARGIRTATFAVTALSAVVVGIGALATREFVQWEEALTGVAKTVDAPQARIRALGQDFRALSEQIPVTANKLAGLGEQAGQLGVEVDNIRSFVEVTAALGVSTNLAAEEAATGLARFSNVMGTAQANVGRLGSVIVDLGNNLATTEAEILAFAQRMSGAGRIAGLTEAAVLGIGGAMSSVGVKAEAGGTAVQKVLIDINTAVAKGGEEVRQFADVAGVSATRFADLWRSDAAEGFTLFVEGLGRAGDDATVILEDLGLNNQRLVRAFLSLANAGDLLRESVDLGSDAWRENTALADEAARFYDRLGARLSVLRNKVVNTAASFGERLQPVVETAGSILSGFLDTVRDAGPAIGEVASQIAAALPQVIERVVQGVGSLGESLLTAVDIIQRIPVTAGLGLVGLVFLGPAGSTALASIGLVIDMLIEKLGGPVTVAEALNQKLQAAVDRQASLLRQARLVEGTGAQIGGRDAAAALREQAAALGDQIQGIKRTIAGLTSEDFEPVGDGFGQWTQKLGEAFQKLQEFELKLGSLGGAGLDAGGGPVEKAAEADEVVNKIQMPDVQPLVEVPQYIRDANAAALEWDNTLQRIGGTIENQVLGGIAELALNLDSLTGTLKSIGRAIFREIVVQLIKAKIAGKSLAGVFSAAGPLGIAFGAFGLISQFFHSGGIVGARGRGSNVPIVAQSGEVVLSRSAVAQLGGPEQANSLNEGRFPIVPPAAQSGPREIVLSMGAMPEPADYGIIATKPQIGRLFSEMVRTHRQNGGTF